jgi:hypothetical protein
MLDDPPASQSDASLKPALPDKAVPDVLLPDEFG